MSQLKNKGIRGRIDRLDVSQDASSHGICTLDVIIQSASRHLISGRHFQQSSGVTS